MKTTTYRESPAQSTHRVQRQETPPSAQTPEHAPQRAVRVSTPLGEMLLISNGHALTHALFADMSCRRNLPLALQETPEDALLRDAAQQIAQYFHGMRRQFAVPLHPKGSDFDLKVWNALEKIPFGSRATYGEIARDLGAPKAARAVGAACGRNPVVIFTPCHRVVGSTYNLVGYAGGVQRKKALLSLEKAI